MHTVASGVSQRLLKPLVPNGFYLHDLALAAAIFIFLALPYLTGSVVLADLILIQQLGPASRQLILVYLYVLFTRFLHGIAL